MPAKKTNVILFGIDSLRADHMSCYGYHRQTTPPYRPLCRRCRAL